MKTKIFTIILVCLLALSLIALFPISKATVLSDGLVGYWRFDEGTGITANDSSENTNTGTLVSSPSWVTGVYGSALNFIGTNYVSIVDNSSMDFSAGISVFAWINKGTQITGDDAIIAKTMYNWAGDRVFELYAEENSIRVLIGSSECDSPNNLSFNGWLFVGFTYDLHDIKIYINGTNVATVPDTNVILTNANPMFIGSVGWNGWVQSFNGTIDEVRTYNYALTQSSISELYSGVSISASNDVGCSILPSGNVLVGAGQNQSFSITANSGYYLSNLIIDGVDISPSTSYNFTNVNTNHTIQAESTLISNTITMYHIGSGTITPSDGTQLEATGSTITLSAVPAPNYNFMCWLQNGTTISTANPFEYTVTNNYTITAVFYDPTAKPSSNDAIGMAVVFGVIAIGVCAALIFVKKKER